MIAHVMVVLAGALLLASVLYETVDVQIPVPPFGPIRCVGNWLNRLYARNDPTPGEMQYLLRLVELWCRARGLWQPSLAAAIERDFWDYVANGESASVDPEIGGYVNAPCKHGSLDCTDRYLTTCPALQAAQCRTHRNNIPPNWKKIVRELRHWTGVLRDA